MADVFQVYNTTVNAGVTANAPTVTPVIRASTWQVMKVTIVIPAGHAGLTGIQLWYGGGAAIPYNSGWYSGDDEIHTVMLSDAFPFGVPWSVAMLNNDVIAHTFQTRWEMRIVRDTQGNAIAPPVDVTDVYSAADNLVGVG